MRYRKETQAIVSAEWILCCALSCILFGLVSVGFLWQKESLHRNAQEVKKLQRQLDTVRGVNDDYRQRFSFMVSPKALEAKVREQQLNLVAPHPMNVITLPQEEVLSSVSSNRLRVSPRGRSESTEGLVRLGANYGR